MEDVHSSAQSTVYVEQTHAGQSNPESSKSVPDSNNGAGIDRNPSSAAEKNEHGQNSSPGQESSYGLVSDQRYDNTVSGNNEINSIHMTNLASYSLDYNVTNGTTHPSAYGSLGVTSNHGMSSETGEQGLDQSYADVAYSAEEDRLWNMVRVNCLDFSAWTSLIEETEKIAQHDITKVRKVYDAFLAEFPLCFGYWKKYADHEGRLHSIDKVIEVYERAVLAVTYSVEIWVNYCQFSLSTYDDPDIIRRLFERGLAYVGTDYRSDQLWDEYIRYEESLQSWSHLALIYTRILEHPIQQLDRYFNCFKELCMMRSLSEMCTAEEVAMLAAAVESGNGGLEGQIHPSDGEESTKPIGTGLTEAQELEKYVAIREDMYRKAKEYDSKIVSFETAIRRPYFHVRPLDEPEIENWHNYLDFIERGDDFNKFRHIGCIICFNCLSVRRSHLVCGILN